MASKTNHRPSLTRGAGEGRLKGWVVGEGAEEDPPCKWAGPWPGRGRGRGEPGLARDAGVVGETRRGSPSAGEIPSPWRV